MASDERKCLTSLKFKDALTKSAYVNRRIFSSVCLRLTCHLQSESFISTQISKALIFLYEMNCHNLTLVPFFFCNVLNNNRNYKSSKHS